MVLKSRKKNLVIKFQVHFIGRDGKKLESF